MCESTYAPFTTFLKLSFWAWAFTSGSNLKQHNAKPGSPYFGSARARKPSAAVAKGVCCGRSVPQVSLQSFGGPPASVGTCPGLRGIVHQAAAEDRSFGRHCPANRRPQRVPEAGAFKSWERLVDIPPCGCEEASPSGGGRPATGRYVGGHANPQDYSL